MSEIEIGGKFIKAELPTHKNPLPPFIQAKADNKVEPYKNVNVIIIPENATNGDMIKAMFNCMVIEISKGKVYVEGIYFPFDEEWWNAPYKVKSEVEVSLHVSVGEREKEEFIYGKTNL